MQCTFKKTGNLLLMTKQCFEQKTKLFPAREMTFKSLTENRDRIMLPKVPKLKDAKASIVHVINNNNNTGYCFPVWKAYGKRTKTFLSLRQLCQFELSISTVFGVGSFKKQSIFFASSFPFYVAICCLFGNTVYLSFLSIFRA